MRSPAMKLMFVRSPVRDTTGHGELPESDPCRLTTISRFIGPSLAPRERTMNTFEQADGRYTEPAKEHHADIAAIRVIENSPNMHTPMHLIY